MHKFIGTVVSFAVACTIAARPACSQTPQQSNASDSTSTVSTVQRPTTSTQLHRPRIGLALGGGGSRGAAHVGVLKVLQEEHIPIDMIAGTSIGSVVGGFYAAGKPVDEIGEMFTTNAFTKEFTPMPLVRLATEPTELTLRLFGWHPYDGLYFGWKFRGYVNKTIGQKNIEQLNIPYAAVVTDAVTGKSVRLTSGDVAYAMQASTAVPGLKKPVQIADKLYCDGGTINNVPVDHAREMGADFVIAVDIDQPLKDQPISNFRKLGSMERQALNIQLAAFDAQSAKTADVYIHPDTSKINLVSFHKGDGQVGIDAGIKAARAAMPEIKRKLAAIGIVPAQLSSAQH